MLRYAFLIAAVPALGCVSTNSFINRGDSIARMHSATTPEMDAEIAKAQAARPQVKFPCRVAIHFQQPAGCWRWTPADKASFEYMGEKLKQCGIATEVFALSQLTLPGDKSPDLAQLRVAAARHGADLICVIQGNADTQTTKNLAAVANLTIVGGFIIPGSTCDARFTVTGSVVDVANGYLYAAVDSEEETTILRPTFTLEEAVAVEKAKRRALERFHPIWFKRLVTLKETFGNPPSLVIDPTAGPALVTPLVAADKSK